jgi:hypothetical protein
MPNRIARWCLALVCLGLTATVASAQTPTPAASRLRVYLDCNQDCFADYLRTELKWVDFVRQPQDADVQVLASGGDTGGGGREVVLRLVGLRRFAGMEHQARALSIAADSEDARRRTVLQTVSASLLAFAAREGLLSGLTLSVRTAETPNARPTSDPWNLWVFRVGASGSFESTESNRERQWEFETNADRVTDRWKTSVRVNIEQTKETFDLDEDEPLSVTRREREVEGFVAKSLGEHWSVGAEARANSSTFGNVRFGAETLAALEFNVFPYSQYARRLLRIDYGVGARHSKYTEVTLFGKLSETRPRHVLSATLDQREPWGTLEAGVEWSQFLHDMSKSRLEVDGELSFRIARGLSLNVEGQASRIRDQISLPRRGATAQEVLLRVRQLQSGHEVQFSVGVSYSFGSIFNNIVNPRFGR